MSELTVVLKGDDKTYRQKFLCYDPYQVVFDDPWIVACIEEAKQSFGTDPDSIEIKIHLEIQ